VGTLAREDNEEAAKLILEAFLEGNERQLKDMKYHENSLYDFITEGFNDEKYLATFKKIITILTGKLT